MLSETKSAFGGKRLLMVFSIVVLSLGFIQTPTRAEKLTVEALKQLFNPTVTESLFLDVWAEIKELYLGSIPFSEEDVSEMFQNLQRDIKDNPASKDSLIYSATNDLVKLLGNRYTRFLDPEQVERIYGPRSKEYSGIGVCLNFLEKTMEPIILFVNPGCPADKAGLRQGDVIRAIDGETTAGLGPRKAIGLLKGVHGSTVNLSISRQRKSLRIKVIREKTKARSVYSEMVDSVAHIRIMDFDEHAYFQFLDASRLAFEKGCHGAVIDVRWNSGGRIDEALMILNRWMRGLMATLKYKNKEKRVEVNSSFKPFTAFLKIPTVVLINSGSASASEMTAGAFQNYGEGTIVGTTSFGKGCGQDAIVFKDGSMFVVASFLWETPNGVCINKVGIKPDVEVEFTESDLLAGRDPQMEKAIEIIKQQSNRREIDLNDRIQPAEMDSLRKEFNRRNH